MVRHSVGSRSSAPRSVWRVRYGCATHRPGAVAQWTDRDGHGAQPVSYGPEASHGQHDRGLPGGVCLLPHAARWRVQRPRVESADAHGTLSNVFVRIHGHDHRPATVGCVAPVPVVPRWHDRSRRNHQSADGAQSSQPPWRANRTVLRRLPHGGEPGRRAQLGERVLRHRSSQTAPHRHGIRSITRSVLPFRCSRPSGGLETLRREGPVCYVSRPSLPAVPTLSSHLNTGGSICSACHIGGPGESTAHFW